MSYGFTHNLSKQLQDHTCIITGHTIGNVSWQLQRGDETITVPVQGRNSVKSMGFALQACLARLGVALLPHALIEAHVKSNKLQLLLDGYSLSEGGGSNG